MPLKPIYRLEDLPEHLRERLDVPPPARLPARLRHAATLLLEAAATLREQGEQGSPYLLEARADSVQQCALLVELSLAEAGLLGPDQAVH